MGPINHGRALPNLEPKRIFPPLTCLCQKVGHTEEKCNLINMYYCYRLKLMLSLSLYLPLSGVGVTLPQAFLNLPKEYASLCRLYFAQRYLAHETRGS
jgi:hypothetical protein